MVEQEPYAITLSRGPKANCYELNFYAGIYCTEGQFITGIDYEWQAAVELHGVTSIATQWQQIREKADRFRDAVFNNSLMRDESEPEPANTPRFTVIDGGKKNGM